MTKNIVATVEKSAVWQWVAFGALAIGGVLVFTAWREARKADIADKQATDAAVEQDKTEEAVEEVALAAIGNGNRRGNEILSQAIRQPRGWINAKGKRGAIWSSQKKLAGEPCEVVGGIMGTWTSCDNPDAPANCQTGTLYCKTVDSRRA